MLIRQTILYLPAQLLGPLFQFIAAVVWTHWLTPDAYGILTFIIAAQELAYVLTNSWWSHYMMRYAGTFAATGEGGQFQRAENAVLLAASIAQALIAIAVLVSLGQPVTTQLLVGTVLFITTRSTTTHLLERARAQGFIFAYSVGQMVGPVLGFGLAYAAVSLIAATPEAAIAGFALAQAAGLVWLWRLLGLGIAIAVPSRQILLAAMKYGVPLILAGVIGWISMNGIRVVVDHMRGVEAVGLISVGWGLGQRIASVVAMLVTAAAYPLAVKRLQAGARTEALQQLSDNGALLLALLAPAVAGIVMLTPEMVHLMIAEPFRAVTISVLPLAALTGAVRNLRVHFADQVLLLMERTHLMIYLNAIEALAVVAFCALGLHFGGFPGATAGCLAGSTLGTILGFALGRIRFGLPLPWAHGLRIMLATALMALALAQPFWQQVFPGVLARVLAEMAAGVLAYGIALAALYPAFVVEAASRLQRRRFLAG